MHFDTHKHQDVSDSESGGQKMETFTQLLQVCLRGGAWASATLN